MQNGPVQTSKVQSQLPVLWKQGCAGAGACGLLRTMWFISQLCICDVTLEAGNQPLEACTAQKSADATSQGLTSTMTSWLITKTSAVAVMHVFLSMLCVCVCVSVCVCVCTNYFLQLLKWTATHRNFFADYGLKFQDHFLPRIMLQYFQQKCWYAKGQTLLCCICPLKAMR